MKKFCFITWIDHPGLFFNSPFPSGSIPGLASSEICISHLFHMKQHGSNNLSAAFPLSWKRTEVTASGVVL
ncbi:MAG: hypothetical protein A3J80_11425 [Desulfobacula sp. RIFOXYB2_FULL_45_6]|nr:MAG: hypothetical protein A3J80_11425 [Desulfobacula sp. RIFOXYB2_FULL_45_6]